MATVTFHSAGAVTGATAAATPLSVAYPGTVPAGKKAAMFIEAKPFNTTITVPTGWSLAPPTGQATNGSTAGGLNTGSTRGAWLELDTLTTGSEGGTSVSVTLTTGNADGAQIILLESDTGAFDASISAFGSKVGNSANMSAACSTGTFTDLLAGDLVLVGFAMNASLGTPNTDTYSQTGVTPGTVTNRGDQPITTGNDSRVRVNSVPITSVTTPSGSPTVGYTNTSSTSGTAGVLRVRGTAAVQQSGAGSVAATSTTPGAGTILAAAAGTLAAVAALAGAGTALAPSAGTVPATTATSAAAAFKTPGAGSAAAVSGAPGSSTARLAGAGSLAAISGTSGAADVITAAVQHAGAGTVAATSGTTGSATARATAAGSAGVSSGISGATAALLPASGTTAVVSWTTGAAVEAVESRDVAVLSIVEHSRGIDITPNRRTATIAAHARAVSIEPHQDVTIRSHARTVTIEET